tara:strand:- start:688 stop:1281 length:594 start_codon:yes stop_codon:yes gene_type:complete
MPSKSKAQQRFMGLVHAYKKGEVPTSKVSKSVKDAAKSMSKKDTEKYASTKHKGLPNKVKKEMLKKLREMIRLELETCGYTHSVTGRKLKSPGGTGPEDRDLKESNKDENDYLKNQALTQEEVTKSKGVQKIFDIQKNGYGKLGGRTLDSLSAGLFTQLYDKASDPIKEKMNKLNEKKLYIVIGNMWKKFGKNVSLR